MKEIRKLGSINYNNSNPDPKIWISLKKGNPKALETIFFENYPYLYDYGIKLTNREDQVRDCIQDIFAYLWEKRNKISDVSSIRWYLIVTLRRVLFKSVEKRNKRKKILHEIAIEYNNETASFEDLLIYEEMEVEKSKKLKSAFKKIPERMREVLYLKSYQQLSYKEISEVMKVSPQVARNYASEAYKRLRMIFATKQ